MKNISFDSLVAITVLIVLLPVVDLVGSQKNGTIHVSKRKSEGVIVYSDKAPDNQTTAGLMGMTSSKTIPGNWNLDIITVPASASTSSQGNLDSLPSGQYHNIFEAPSSSSSSSPVLGRNMYYKLPLSSSSTVLPRSSVRTITEHYARVSSPFTLTTARTLSNQLVSSPAEIPFPLASSSRVSGPYFESNRSTIHISAKAGQTVILDCAVILLQGRTVSWLRRAKDSLQLLTVGNTTYNGDSRLGLRFRYPNNWRLEIVSVSKLDESEYQCQLSTHPPKVLIYHLKVIAPTVIILDENGHTVTERHYKVDSSLHLTCRASNVDKFVEKVVWLKGDRALPGGDSRIKVKMAKSDENGEASTFLSVLSVRTTDSGTYSCATSLATSTVTVHVLNGELPAAVQHENCAHKMGTPSLQVGVVIVVGVYSTICSLNMFLFSMSQAGFPVFL